MRTEAQKQANREAQVRFRERHPERTKAWTKKYYWQKKTEVLDLLGKMCVRCGFDDARALKVDHIIPVRHRSGGRREWSAEMKLVREHPENYQILCANCHAIKTRTEDFA